MHLFTNHCAPIIVLQQIVHYTNLTSSNCGVLLLELPISLMKITKLPGRMLVMTMTIVKGEIQISIKILTMIQCAFLYLLLNHPAPIAVLQF